MRNLFGFNPEYIDRDAGLSEAEKYRKWVSKANVDMVINHFSPFNKAKNQKGKTTTVVSMDNSNIDGLSGPVAFHSKGKENKIFVNSSNMTTALEDVPIDKRLDKFKKLMQGAYVARSDINSMNDRTNVSSYDPKVSDDQTGAIPILGEKKSKLIQEIHRQMLLTAQMMQYGCMEYTDSVELTGGLEDDPVFDLAHAMATGSMPKSTWAQGMLGDIKAAGKQRGLYNKWADELATKINHEYGEPVQMHADESDFENILNENLPITRKYYVPEKPKDSDKDGKEACTVGDGRMEYNDEPKFAEQDSKGDADFTDTNDVVDYKDLDTKTKSKFFVDDRKKRDEENWRKRDANMSRLAEALYESLSGRIGKINSENPSKKLNMRALASDVSDNIYRSNLPTGGKELDLNLILDTSGSMSGDHIEDGLDVINCINKLAERGVIKGNLMLSCSGASAMMSFPVDPDLIPRMSAHNGGEGFKHTMGLRWKELQAADYNVAITDGQLTDGYIDMKEMEAAGIYIVGLYSMRSIKDDKKRALSYSGSLKRWFSNSAVRANAEEMIYYLIDNAILNYEMNPRRSA